MSEDLTPLEQALAGLRPAAPALDRGALLYHAGRASRDRAVRGWRLTAGGLAVALAVAVGFAVRPPRVAVVERVVEVRVEVPVPSLPPTPPPPDPPRSGPDPAEFAAYLKLRDDVLAAGPSALPPAPPRRPAPSPTGAELERSLGVPPGTLAAPYRLRD